MNSIRYYFLLPDGQPAAEPVEEARMVAWIKEGSFPRDRRVCREGQEEWVPAGEHMRLSPAFYVPPEPSRASVFGYACLVCGLLIMCGSLFYGVSVSASTGEVVSSGGVFNLSRAHTQGLALHFGGFLFVGGAGMIAAARVADRTKED